MQHAEVANAATVASTPYAKITRVITPCQYGPVKDKKYPYS